MLSCDAQVAKAIKHQTQRKISILFLHYGEQMFLKCQGLFRMVPLSKAQKHENLAHPLHFLGAG